MTRAVCSSSTSTAISTACARRGGWRRPAHQPRGDLAAAQARAGLQDHCRFPPRQPLRRDRRVQAFVRFCRQAGLFAAAVAVIDGSKVRAAASRRQVIEQAELEAELVALDRQIGDYLLALGAADANETDDTSSQQTRAALQALKDEREELLELANAMAAEERTLGVRGEPEARPMGSGQGAKPPSYNLQIAVDPDSHMIVHHDLTTDATDNRQLHPMAQ